MIGLNNEQFNEYPIKDMGLRQKWSFYLVTIRNVIDYKLNRFKFGWHLIVISKGYNST